MKEEGVSDEKTRGVSDHVWEFAGVHFHKV